MNRLNPKTLVQFLSIMAAAQWLFLPSAASAVDLPLAELATQIDRSGLPVDAKIDIEIIKTDVPARQADCAGPRFSFPRGARPLGRSMVTIQCHGAQPMTLYQPVEIHAWAPVLIAQQSIAFQDTVQDNQLSNQEVDLSRLPGKQWLTRPDDVIGRQAIRNIAAGAVLRSDMFRTKPTIQAGDVVKIAVRGPGFSISGEGTALSSAGQGQSLKVKTTQGKVLTGLARDDLMVDVQL
ncbi:MAG: flagellar basal body P-ring formation chaperone FlgA [Burkholderiaceae bacterium]